MAAMTVSLPSSSILDIGNRNNNSEHKQNNDVAHHRRGFFRHDRHHLCWYEQTVAYIENEVEHTILRSPFLQTTRPKTLPKITATTDTTKTMGDVEVDDDGVVPDNDELYFGLFHRSEIRTGQLVGRGGFSDVYEILAFDLSDEISGTLSTEKQWIRTKYSKNALDGHGRARFVIKQLQYQLLQSNPIDFQRAAADLAIEAAYMSVLDHPNILSLRGLPVDGIEAFLDGEHDSYFIITDRLYETLEDRINRWKLHENNHDDATFESKIRFAHELANALEYLHERRIIFRDLKPANIGFTRTTTDDGGEIGRLQLFDFGLCRQLPPPTEAINDVYEMSGVGTRRYMAPENVLTSQYNCKADVYSWSLIVWEMLCLKTPYDEYKNMQQHKEHVCQGGHRPTIPSCWPESLQNLLMKSWMENIRERIPIQVVCQEVHDILFCIIEERKQQQWLLMEYFQPSATSFTESIRFLTTTTTKRNNGKTTSTKDQEKYRRIYNFTWSDMMSVGNVGVSGAIGCGNMLPLLECLSDDTLDDDDASESQPGSVSYEV